ncbi:hypothetical protein E1A91_D01G101300v1 [Gossypium mustelinum]|uniref:Uncharacterized protein n=1 Tax=Gossypium mustelinum TaxID=34275 RepID=A0A5D2W5B0_GOSMU|nr:hypothetical protein E1A91_D01G101300v1 [Gossypium mustelinum]
MNYAVFVGSSVINLEVDKDKYAIVLPRNFLLDRIVILFLLHMDFQEQFFKERIKFIHEARDEKEESFEKLQQQEREKVKQSNPNPSNAEEYKRRADEIAKFIKDKLIKAHEKKMVGMRERHWQEEVELEKEFDAKLSHLMEKYTLDGSKVNAGNT